MYQFGFAPSEQATTNLLSPGINAIPLGLVIESTSRITSPLAFTLYTPLNEISFFASLSFCVCNPYGGSVKNNSPALLYTASLGLLNLLPLYLSARVINFASGLSRGASILAICLLP